MYLVIFEIVGVIAGLIKFFLFGVSRDMTALLSDLLICQLAVTTFLSGVFGFVGHYFKSDYVAGTIGWPKGNPFQKEVAFSNLACGIGSFGAGFMGKEYWLACIVFVTVFYGGASIEHIKELKKKKNMNPGNLLMILPDVMLPLLMIILYVVLSVNYPS